MKQVLRIPTVKFNKKDFMKQVLRISTLIFNRKIKFWDQFIWIYELCSNYLWTFTSLLGI